MVCNKNQLSVGAASQLCRGWAPQGPGKGHSPEVRNQDARDSWPLNGHHEQLSLSKASRLHHQLLLPYLKGQ